MNSYSLLTWADLHWNDILANHIRLLKLSQSLTNQRQSRSEISQGPSSHMSLSEIGACTGRHTPLYCAEVFASRSHLFKTLRLLLPDTQWCLLLSVCPYCGEASSTLSDGQNIISWSMFILPFDSISAVSSFELCSPIPVLWQVDLSRNSSCWSCHVDYCDLGTLVGFRFAATATLTVPASLESFLSDSHLHFSRMMMIPTFPCLCICRWRSRNPRYLLLIVVFVFVRYSQAQRRFSLFVAIR